MKRTEFYFGLLALGLLSVSCEDRIDVDLNAAAPRVVIEADLDDMYTHLPRPPKDGQNPPEGGVLPPEGGWGEDGEWKGPKQFVYVSRSVAFDDHRHRETISDATVEIEEVDTGKKFPFVYAEDEDAETRLGMDPFFLLPYESDTFAPVPGRTYTLRVWVDGQLYASSETMPAYIEPDSITAERDDRFGDDARYYGVFEFRDPPGEANYYRYMPFYGHNLPISFGDHRVFSDKFNDGRKANHRFKVSVWNSGSDEEGKTKIVSRVKRQVISPAVYQYWRGARAINPAATAPANPTSNISNGALGYFSVSSARLHQVDISEVYQPGEGSGGN